MARVINQQNLRIIGKPANINVVQLGIAESTCPVGIHLLEQCKGQSSQTDTDETDYVSHVAEKTNYGNVTKSLQ